MTWQNGFIIYFYFSFLFLLDLLYRKEYEKVLYHKCHIVTVTLMSHDESHDRHRKTVHRPCSSCVENLIGTLLSSPC